MPLIESAPDAVSRMYAQSLFELCQEQGGGAAQSAIEEASDEIESIVELARTDKSFGEFLSSRIIPSGARAESLKKILAGRINDRTLRFLLVLNEKGRLGHLAAVCASFDQIAQSAFGRVEVDVYTASPADRAQLDGIKARLQAALGKEPVLHAYTDPSMIGGLRLQIGDQLIDGSISTRLQKMKGRLNNEGAAQVRANSGRIVDLTADYAANNGH